LLRRFSFTAQSASWSHPLSLHDALPIFVARREGLGHGAVGLAQDAAGKFDGRGLVGQNRHLPATAALAADRDFARLHRLESDGADRKSTRLNSSHVKISYAVFCLKKKKK